MPLCPTAVSGPNTYVSITTSPDCFFILKFEQWMINSTAVNHDFTSLPIGTCQPACEFIHIVMGSRVEKQLESH